MTELCVEGLNPNSIVPLYYQLKELIKQKVDNGTWVYNQKIPAESELAETYKISTGTVKKALSDLVNEGVLIRKKGKGSFIKKVKFSKNWFCCLFPGEDELKVKVLSFSNVENKREFYESAFEEPKFFQLLLRDKQNKVVSLRNLYFDNRLYLLKDKAGISFTKYHRQSFSEFRYALEQIQIETCKPEWNKWFEFKKKETVLRLTRRSYAPDDRLIEVREDFFPAEKFLLTQRIE